MSVVEAVERDLAELDRRKPGLAASSLASVARALARELDNPKAATAFPMNSREFRETMAALEQMAPAEQTKDALDDLAARRAARRARSA